MNIAFLSFDSSASIGGIGVVTSALVESFKKRFNFKCYLIHNRSESSPSIIYDGKFNYTESKDKNSLIDFLIENKIKIVIDQGVLPAIMPDIREIADKSNCKIISVVHAKPDLIKIFPSYYSLFWELKRIKSLISKLFILFKILIFPAYKSISNIKYKRWRKFIYNYSDKVIVLSKFYIKNYVDMLNLMGNHKVTSIPNPLRFSDSFEKSKLSSKQNEVLVVSRLNEIDKNLSSVFKVWKIIQNDPMLNDWKLRIVGSGRDENMYKNIVKTNNLRNVTFEGVQDPLDYYKKAKIFLMTSTHEGFPMALAEALQMGLPIVVFDNFESLHEIVIDNYNGFIISKNDISGFAAKLGELMKDENKRIVFAENALDYSTNFTIDKISEMWFSLFMQLTNEEGSK